MLHLLGGWGEDCRAEKYVVGALLLPFSLLCLLFLLHLQPVFASLCLEVFPYLGSALAGFEVGAKAEAARLIDFVVVHEGGLGFAEVRVVLVL